MEVSFVEQVAYECPPYVKLGHSVVIAKGLAANYLNCPYGMAFLLPVASLLLVSLSSLLTTP